MFDMLLYDKEWGYFKHKNIIICTALVFMRHDFVDTMSCISTVSVDSLINIILFGS